MEKAYIRVHCFPFFFCSCFLDDLAFEKSAYLLSSMSYMFANKVSVLSCNCQELHYPTVEFFHASVSFTNKMCNSAATTALPKKVVGQHRHCSKACSRISYHKFWQCMLAASQKVPVPKGLPILYWMALHQSQNDMTLSPIVFQMCFHLTPNILNPV